MSNIQLFFPWRFYFLRYNHVPHFGQKILFFTVFFSIFRRSYVNKITVYLKSGKFKDSIYEIWKLQHQLIKYSFFHRFSNVYILKILDKNIYTLLTGSRILSLVIKVLQYQNDFNLNEAFPSRNSVNFDQILNWSLAKFLFWDPFPLHWSTRAWRTSLLHLLN